MGVHLRQSPTSVPQEPVKAWWSKRNERAWGKHTRVAGRRRQYLGLSEAVRTI
ncbi:uncharacterized protein PHALS_00986 [Plasmopara halstedii]|uniref:Uncharacterized protein n=1 Tax=Plasmopara halstedii TaxID=4781 RepID=A0A0P1ATM6_PLAHL|nr:uncharacterized protein PHALS_00986 [Plasmopara halstedii]CEG44640.1 hypothetical protein PHALS_00986 [Plasmopara halstedii]|eukprot:XP_024581009.1 hypothetical protein PHALS_00986 [Plasmopara halstedii]